MSIHINAKPMQVAPVVLMPGDPLRAKYIAEKWLSSCELVSQTRNNFYYTGNYNGKRLSVGASGMGIPSMGIYSYELYTQYDVQCIMRIGTCGAYHTSLDLYDLINTDKAFSESTYAQCAFGFKENFMDVQGSMYNLINDTAKDLKLKLTTVPSLQDLSFFSQE